MTAATSNVPAIAWSRPAATAALSITLVLLPSVRASASLGGDVSSVQADQARLQGAVMPMTNSGSYNIHEMRAASGIIVREYVSPAGKVFAVTWQGPSLPDLRQLLGDYFAPYTQAAQAARKTRAGHGPVRIETSAFVVEQSGHPRAFTGRAYIPQLMPALVLPQAIR